MGPIGSYFFFVRVLWAEVQCRIVHKIAEQDSETLETLKWTGFLSKMQR